MITIFGTTYFTTGAGLVVLVLAAPLLFWFARWLWRPNVEDKPLRVQRLAVGGTTLGLLALLAVGLFWDVYLIGQRARELCAEAGLVVNRRAEAEGFAGSAAIERWAKHGFGFVETDSAGVKTRYEMVNGKPTTHPISSLKARHLVVLVDSAIEGGDRLTKARIRKRGALIKDLDTGDIIAELKKFTIRHGWFDSTIIGVTGFAARSYTCGRDRNGEPSYSENQLGVEDLVIATLKPIAGSR